MRSLRSDGSQSKRYAKSKAMPGQISSVNSNVHVYKPQTKHQFGKRQEETKKAPERSPVVKQDLPVTKLANS